MATKIAPKRKHTKKTASKHPAVKKTTKATVKKAPAKQADKASSAASAATAVATQTAAETATEAAQKPDAVEQPIGTIANPYRRTSGYGILFDILATHPPMDRAQVIELAEAEIERLGKHFRADFGFAVVTAKKHKSKRGNYQVVRDEQGLWHLIPGESAKATE